MSRYRSSSLASGPRCAAEVLPASGADIPAIESLHERCSMESVRARYLGVPPRDVVRILNETTETFLVRARDSDVLAVGHLAIRMGEVTLFGEVAVLVRDDHRRHGHGAQLIAAMAQAARSRGVRDLTTVARDGDPAAAPLMRSALGEVRVEVADGLATVSSELTLPSESPPAR